MLCVTASVSGICKAGALYSSFYVCLFDAALEKKEWPNCHMFVKRLSVALDKEFVLNLATLFPVYNRLLAR